MPTLLGPPWAVQPPAGTPLSGGHGLLACWPMNEAAGTLCYDATGRHAPASFVGSVSRAVGVDGLATSFPTSSGNYLSASPGPILLGNATNWTIAARFATTAPDISGGRLIYSERPASGSDILDLDGFATGGPGSSPTAPFVTLRNDAGTLLQLFPPSGYVFNDGKVHSAVATRTGSATAGYTITLYLDGVPVASATWSGSDSYTNAIASQIGGNAAAPGNGFAGTLSLVALWPRGLSAAEVLAWHARPWEAFQAPRRRRRLATAAPAGASAVVGGHAAPGGLAAAALGF